MFDFNAAMKPKSGEEMAQGGINVEPPVTNGPVVQEPVKSDVAIIDPMDPAPLLKKFDEFREKIQEMKETAAGHTVTDASSNEQAVEMTTQAKKLASVIEKKRKELKEPYLKVTSFLDSETKTLKDGLAEVQGILNGKITPYLQEQEKLRQEAERKAEDEAQKEQERLAAEARAKAEAEAKRMAEEQNMTELETEKAITQAVEAAEAAVPEVVTDVPREIKTVTSTGTADLKKEWTWEITNFLELPPEVFETRKDQITKAIAPYLNAQVKAGIRSISGVRIYEEAKLNTRAK